MTRSSCQHVQEQLLDMVGRSVPPEAGPLRDHLDSCPVCKAYWAALCADDALLRDCIDALQPAVARIEDGVRRQLAQVPPGGTGSFSALGKGACTPFRRERDRHLFGGRKGASPVWNPRTGIAAAAVLALGLYLLFGRSRVTLYNQVLGALDEVQTVHLVEATLRDGRWEKQTDLWYDREAGVAATVWQDSQKTIIRIDPHEEEPAVAAGSGVGRPGPGTKALKVAADLLQTGLFTWDFVRESREDKTVAGVPCRAYSLFNEAGTANLLAWLDDAKRVRAWEKRRLLTDGTWETYRTGTIEYDVTPNPRLFQPADVNAVDVDPAR